MAERLPDPSIPAPDSRLDCLYRLNEETEEWLATRQGTSWDSQRAARIALSNVNLCLDYYPDGIHRDLRSDSGGVPYIEQQAA